MGPPTIRHQNEYLMIQIPLSRRREFANRGIVGVSDGLLMEIKVLAELKRPPLQILGGN